MYNKFYSVWSSEVQCSSQKGSPIIPILSRIQFLVLTPIYLRFTLIFSHLRLRLLRALFLVELSVKILKALLLSSILAICHAHINLLDLITLCKVNGMEIQLYT